MDTKQIDFGKALIKILDLIIVKPLTLPVKIYGNSLRNLSNADAADSEESVLSSDFPLYVWFISIYDALIAVSYPIGALMALVLGTNRMTGGIGSFVMVLAIVYFVPLAFGFFRELGQLYLKVVLYLKIISKK